MVARKLGCQKMQDADLTWKTFCYQVRDRNGKLADIWLSEGYEDISNMGGGVFRTRCTGPNGLKTETFQQMLQLLGADPPAGMPWLKPSEQTLPAPPESEPQPQVSPDVQTEAMLAQLAPASDQIRADYESNHLAAAGLAQGLAESLEAPCPEAAERAESAKQERKGEVNVAKSAECEYYEAKGPDYEDEGEEDGSRPDPIRAEDIARIDDMSPNELNTLIDDVDAHEQWEELRREAKQRIESWKGGLKVAHQSPRCGYLKNNGKPCGSPAMKDDSFCYFHSQARIQRDSVAVAGNLELPSLEDHLGVQLAIMRVCGMLVDKRLDEKTGRAVLAGLRLAQKNLGHANALFGPNDLD